MTKKDYERAATLVQEARTKGTAVYDADIEDVFIAFFGDDNPRFNAERFHAACKPGANARARGARGRAA